MRKTRGVRILLVEDNQTNQEVAFGILSHLGYDSVEVAADGKHALRELAEKDFDLVLMDCQLPDMDGYETARLIRKRKTAVRNHDIPIIATTAHAMAGDRERCLAAGMNGYVSKPIGFRALEQTIEECTGGTRTPVEPALASRAFDREEFDERIMGNDDMARRIIRGFVDDMPGQIAQLALAVNDGDFQQTRFLAHSIKGAAASVSGLEIREASQKIEQQAREGNLIAAAEALTELSVSFARAKTVMESYCREE